jgi:hypothetical protein
MRVVADYTRPFLMSVTYLDCTLYLSPIVLLFA